MRLAPGTVFRRPSLRFSAAVGMVQTLEMWFITPLLLLMGALDIEAFRASPVVSVLVAGVLCLAIVIHAERQLNRQRSTLEKIAKSYSIPTHTWVVIRSFLFMLASILFPLLCLYLVAIEFYTT